MSAADVRQCPRCELRFGARAELVEHLVGEHGFARGSVEPLRYPVTPRPPAESGTDGHRCLVVANQTLGGPDLMAAIRDSIEAGTTRFLVLVPATTGQDVALSRVRLQAVVDGLLEEGVDVRGELGASDPELAVHELLRSEPVDEILVATLPPGISRWLRTDLPGRLQRQLHLPVTTVVTRSAHSLA